MKNDSPKCQEGCTAPDVIVPVGVQEDGVEGFVRHTSEHDVIVGAMKPVPASLEGVPDDAVLASPTLGGLYRVVGTAGEVRTTRSRTGEATRAYRDGWDRTFSRKDLN